MSLITFLKSSPNTRKIFGKRELIILKKQLMGINLTQSEKNRLSRDIRKKFKFIKEAAAFQDEFELKKGLIIKKQIEEIKPIILGDKLRQNITEIWLCGSTVENARTFRSDIDIVVLFDKISLKEATSFRIRISSNFSENVDIQVFNVLPKRIKASMRSIHRILWKRD